jgi:hypothetical protein
MTAFGLIVLRYSTYELVGCVYFDHYLEVFIQLEEMKCLRKTVDLSLDPLTAIAFSTMAYYINQSRSSPNSTARWFYFCSLVTVFALCLGILIHRLKTIIYLELG